MYEYMMYVCDIHIAEVYNLIRLRVYLFLVLMHEEH